MLETTDPSANAVLADSPATVSLTFNEPIGLAETPLRVLDVDGNQIDLGDPRAVDETISVSLPPDLPDGSYVVAWRVISADAHPVAGAYTFAVGAPSTSSSGQRPEDLVDRAGGDDDSSQAAVDVAMGFTYLGVLLAAGAAVFVVAVFPVGLPPASRPVLVLARTGALVAVAASVLGVLAEAAQYAGAGLGWPSARDVRHVAAGSVGVQAGLVIVGAIVVTLSVGQLIRRSPLAVVGSVVGAGLMTSALAVVGHTRTTEPIALTVLTDVVHVVAAAVWVGGVTGLLLFLRANARVEPPDVSPAEAEAEAVGRFSAMATVAIIAVLVAGSILGWRIVGSLHALTSTTYGTLLLVKIGLFAVVAAIGAYNRFVLVDRLVADRRACATGHPSRTLRRTLLAEATVMIAIIAVTGALTSTSPHLPTTADDGMAGMPGMDHGHEATSTIPGSVTAKDDFGDGEAHLTVLPARIGENRFVVSFLDAAGKPLVPISAPIIELRLRDQDVGPITATATRRPDGTYAVTQELSLPGSWEVNVAASVSDFDQRQAIFAITVS